MRTGPLDDPLLSVCLTIVMSAWLARRRSRIPSPDIQDERAFRYAARLLTQAREELNRIDTKASILLAGIGVALSAAVGIIAAKGWSPFRLPLGPEILWWAAAATFGAGSTVLLAAVYPRRRQVAGGSPGNRRPYFSYYADVAGSRSAAEVAATIRLSARREFELVTEQLLQVSMIVDRKYRLVRRAMWLLAAGVACGVAMIMLNAA